MPASATRPSNGPGIRFRSTSSGLARPLQLVLLLAVGLVAACLSRTGVGDPVGPEGQPAAGAQRVVLPSGSGVYARAVPPGSLRRDRPVVLVPGAAWLEGDLLLPERPAVFVDLPGRGQADPADLARAGLEEDLAALEDLRARLGIERVVLVGWGYYGGLAVRYALARPERVEALVLLSPLPPRREPHWGDFVARAQMRTDREALEQLAAVRASGGKERQPFEFCQELTRLFVESRTVDPDAALERMRSQPCVAPNLDPDVGSALGGAIVEGLGNWDWRAELGAIEAPTLIVHGREDPYPYEGSEEYAAGLANARLVVLDDCGHLPWLERPAEFEAVLAGFLARLEAP